MNLNTTREERDSSAIRFRIESLVQDTNTLEDELARVREMLSALDSEHTISTNGLHQDLEMVRAERDKLRDELESARLLLKELGMRITSIAGAFPKMFSMWLEHKKRFGACDDNNK